MQLWVALIGALGVATAAAIPAIASATKSKDPPPASSPGYVEQAPATRVPDQATIDEEANRIVHGDAVKARDELRTLKEEEELAAAPVA